MLVPLLIIALILAVLGFVTMAKFLLLVALIVVIVAIVAPRSRV